MKRKHTPFTFFNSPKILFVAVWGGVLGSLLLLRKRLAAPVLMVSFLAMVGTTVHNFILADGYEVMGTTGTIMSVVIFLIALFLVKYSRSMASQGVLT